MGKYYMSVVAVPSVMSGMGIGGADHDGRWFEANASKLGGKFFDKRYGSGAEGYIYKNADYFDMESYVKGGLVPYINPRTGLTRQGSSTISFSGYKFWDAYVPASIISGMYPSFIPRFIFD